MINFTSLSTLKIVRDSLVCKRNCCRGKNKSPGYTDVHGILWLNLPLWKQSTAKPCWYVHTGISTLGCKQGGNLSGAASRGDGSQAELCSHKAWPILTPGHLSIGTIWHFKLCWTDLRCFSTLSLLSLLKVFMGLQDRDRAITWNILQKAFQK